MSYLLQSEQVSSELLPSSSQFFPAGAELPFGSPPREEDQAIQALIARVKQLPDAASGGQQHSSAWLHEPQSQTQSEPRSQQVTELLAQLGAQHMHLLQFSAVPHPTVPAGLGVKLSSDNSRKLLSLPSDRQQSGLGAVGAANFQPGRPGELSPVPEQQSISPTAASEAAVDAHRSSRRHLYKSQSQQQQRSPSDGRQLSVLLLPGVTCEPTTAGGPVQQLQTHSAPSSPIQGNMTFVSRSLSLQKASAQPTVVPLQQVLQPQVCQKLHIGSDAPSAQAAATAGNVVGASIPILQQQQQQHMWRSDVGSSSVRGSRESTRELSRQADSMRASGTNPAEVLQLQAEVLRLRDGQRELQDRLTSANQQLVDYQELLSQRQDQLLAARADLAAADNGREAMKEQLAHLEAKVRATESQLEFAHKQLDIRQQELREAADATTAAKRSGEQLATEVETLKDELIASRRGLDAVNTRLALEATEARRAADEAAALKRDLASLQNELNKALQETADARERLRQEVTESDRKMAQFEVQRNDMAQQIMLLKERNSAMQTANDRLHDQLASAEGDNTSLRNDMARLLRAQQELVDSREQLRQLQVDAARRISQLESDVSDLSQQLMFAKSQNDRLNQQLSAADAENAAFHADLDNARAGANSANIALHEAQLQQEQTLQQYRQQLRQQQSQIQQLQQQLDRAAATAAVPPTVSVFGINSSNMNAYQGLRGGLGVEPLRGSRRLDFADDTMGTIGLGGGAALGPSGSRYNVGNSNNNSDSRPDAYQAAGPAAVPANSYSHGSYNRPLPSSSAAVSSSSPPQVWQSSPARGVAEYSTGYNARPASAAAAAAGTYTSSPVGNAYNPISAVSISLQGNASRDGLGVNGQAIDSAVRLAAPNATGTAAGGPRVAWQGPGQLVQQQQVQQGRAATGGQADDAPWFAGGSRTSPNRTSRPIAAQPPQQQQQPQQQPPVAYAAGGGYLAAETSQRWQLPQQQQQQQPQSSWQQQHQQAPGQAAVPARSSSPVRLPAPTMSEQQQHLQAAAGGAVPTPFGTEMTVAEIMATTKELEDLLLACCQEKDDLNKEFSKMSLGAGKTLKERQRKQYVEQRLEELDSSISKTRMQLKKLVGR